MIPAGRLILLDTNIVLHLIRWNRIGQRVEEQYKLRERTERPLISVVTVGEARALARIFKWGESKCDALEERLRELVIVDINVARILDGFGELKAFAQTKGHGIGDNDLWIAATARATDSTLITADMDFDPFHGTFIQREWIDPDGDTPG